MGGGGKREGRLHALTLNFEVHGLGILPNGVAGYADVLPCVRVLNVLQGERRHPRMAAHHDAPI